MNLRELQRSIKEDITHLDFLEHGPLVSEPLLREGPPLSSRSRLEIYGEAWFMRLRGSLEEDYTVVAKALGPKAFERLVRHYLRRHGSRTHTLTHAGDDLPEFLCHWRDGAARPWLADLARLERAQYQCFHAADPVTQDMALLAQLEDLESVAVRLESTVHLLRLDHEVHGMLAGGAAPSLSLEPQCVVVYRQGFRVRSRALQADEFHGLSAIRAPGCTLAGLLDACPQEQFAPWLQRWHKDRLITLTAPERTP